MSFFNGPESTRIFLEKITNFYEERKEKDLKILNEYNSAKLSERFDHFVVINIKSKGDNSLPVSIFIDVKGRVFSGIMTVELTSMASSIYSVEIDEETKTKLSQEYSEFFKVKNPIVTKSIFHTPFRIYFLSLFGNERLIKKEFLKESLSGTNYYKFSDLVKDKTFEYISKYYRKWLNTTKGNILVFPYQEKLKLFFSFPNLSNVKARSIIIELSRLFGEKFIKKVDYFEPCSIPPNIRLGAPVSLAVETSLLNISDVVYKLKDFYLFYSDTLEKTVDFVENYINKNYEL